MTPTLVAIRTKGHFPWGVAAGLVVLAAFAVYGAQQLAFLCDDAYIQFRYVANARAGHGLVWNAPPFLPVEGYTSFLWTVLLWATWSWLGVEPPDAANTLSIACGVLQLVVLAWAATKVERRDGTRLPAAVVLLALLVIATNRTFLQWFTGGLETALFNLAFVSWVLIAFAADRTRARWLFAWSAAAALAALTRPDGLLLVAATIAVAVLLVAQRRHRWYAALLALTPLLTVAAHVAWRRSYYGEWLPNTYFAKVVAPWPEAGVRWFGCFALENGVWLWSLLAGLWLLVEWLRAGRAVWGELRQHAPAGAAIAAVLVHIGYYVLRAGGDHFEYRVLSAAVPLGLLAGIAMAARLGHGLLAPVATAFLLAGAAGFGWLQHALTRDLTCFGVQALTPQVPPLLRPVTRWFDHQQMWLFSRYIGVRCRFHACVLHQEVTLHFPHRLHIVDPPDPFPLMAGGAIGYLGWQLRECALLDLLGLNDWVIARTPATAIDTTAVRERLRTTLPAADLDHDGWLSLTELQAGLVAAGGEPTPGGTDPFLLGVLIAIHAGEHPGKVSFAAAERIGDAIHPERLLAHERHPPPGYLEALAPNVTIANGVATVAPRPTPMTAERVRAIESEWRQRCRARGNKTR